MKNQKLDPTVKAKLNPRKFLAVSAQTWIWVALLVSAIPLFNYYGGVPFIFGLGILVLLGLTFWGSGRSVRADIEKPAPHFEPSSRVMLKSNVHPIQRNRNLHQPRPPQTQNK